VEALHSVVVAEIFSMIVPLGISSMMFSAKAASFLKFMPVLSVHAVRPCEMADEMAV
jgi:hypothetical protein